MKRLVETAMLKWKESSRRKPLIIRGGSSGWQDLARGSEVRRRGAAEKHASHASDLFQLSARVGSLQWPLSRADGTESDLHAALLRGYSG